MKKFNSCMPNNLEHISIWILKKSYRAKDKRTSIGFKFEIFLTSNKEDRDVQNGEEKLSIWNIIFSQVNIKQYIGNKFFAPGKEKTFRCP